MDFLAVDLVTDDFDLILICQIRLCHLWKQSINERMFKLQF